jgi:hypothetical protein
MSTPFAFAMRRPKGMLPNRKARMRRAGHAAGPSAEETGMGR